MRISSTILALLASVLAVNASRPHHNHALDSRRHSKISVRSPTLSTNITNTKRKRCKARHPPPKTTVRFICKFFYLSLVHLLQSSAKPKVTTTKAITTTKAVTTTKAIATTNASKPVVTPNPDLAKGLISVDSFCGNIAATSMTESSQTDLLKLNVSLYRTNYTYIRTKRKH